MAKRPDHLPAGEEPIEGGFTLTRMLLLFTLLPTICIGIAVLIVAGLTVKSTITERIENTLHVSNMQMNDYCHDWYIEEGEEAFTKEEGKEYDYVDEFVDAGLYMTVFIGDTRCMTSITDSTGARIEGTTASDEVIAACLEGGEEYTSDNVVIDGERYLVNYLPMYDDSDNIVGMTFTGMKYTTVSNGVFRTVLQMSVIAGIVAVIFIILCVLFAMKVRRPFREINETLRQFAGGNISGEINVRSTVTENKQMIRCLEVMQENFRKTIGDVKGGADSLSGGVVDVERLSSDSSESAEQISAAVDDLANGATSMAQNVQDLNTEVIQMGEKVEEINDNLNLLVENAENMEEVNAEAARSMEGVLESSRTTTDAVKSINNQIIVTNDSINRINEAIELIISVASQTKLLSLNASIEAARAGEAGKGFAVVADSISDLSEQSNESATTIRGIAEEILQNSNESVELAGRIQEIIDGEQEAVRSTQEKFDQLHQAISRSIENIRLIETTTGELNDIKLELTSNVTDLSAISEENAASNEEVAASVATIVNSVDEIANRMKDMNDMSGDLEDSVSYFK
ncbi:MAG: methyl-accepting chemotaxis protein [Eubacterium sp.]|nr:methyl-accepting chemotaxis protein [Eubacterium sp.]